MTPQTRGRKGHEQAGGSRATTRTSGRRPGWRVAGGCGLETATLDKSRRDGFRARSRLPGDVPADEVMPACVIETSRRVCRCHPATARGLRQGVNAVMEQAVAMEQRPDSPYGWWALDLEDRPWTAAATRAAWTRTLPAWPT